MRRRPATAASLLALALGPVAGCSAPQAPSAANPDAPPPSASSPSAPAAPAPPTPAPQEERVVGTLRSGFAGIGGEHTGWALVQPGGRQPLEVDVSAVFDDARALDGKEIAGWGVTVTKRYVERGPTPIFRFTRIQRMPEAGATPAR
jgi:hypothetical protein